MYEKLFSKRLAELRIQKGVSARDMSLSLGQNPGYIRAIESGSAFPAMSSFFYICEYLNVTPQEFFDFNEDHCKRFAHYLQKWNQLNRWLMPKECSAKWHPQQTA